MNSARKASRACVTNLIAAGARLEMADTNGDTALGQAIVAGRDENIAILRAAGAKDFRITEETGEPVEDGAAPLTVWTTTSRPCTAATSRRWRVSCPALPFN